METRPVQFAPDNVFGSNLTLSMLHHVVEMQVSDSSVYQQFVDEMREFGNQIRRQHGEYSKSVPFQLETAKRYSEEDGTASLVAYRIVFTLPGEKKEAWWCFFNEHGQIDRIQHQTDDFVPNYRH